MVLPTDVVGGGVGNGCCLVGWLFARNSSVDCIPVMLVTREAIVFHNLLHLRVSGWCGLGGGLGCCLVGDPGVWSGVWFFCGVFFQGFLVPGYWLFVGLF